MEQGNLTQERRTYQYYDLIMAAFVTVLLCSNLIGAAKVWSFFGITTTGSVLFFPISYLFGDILTEVYGYRKSRKVVWTGFVALVFASLVSSCVIALPSEASWPHQFSLEIVFSQTPRLAAASLIAYFIGELMNSYVLARMKVITRGKWLGARVIGSTVVGEGIDTLIFYPLAFFGTWPTALLAKIMLTNYSLKVLWEVLMTPVTYKIVRFLKEAEKEDYYDYNTDFSPFPIKE